MLRLENFDVENGPDLYVYTVAAKDASDVETVLDSGFLELGRLKGNRGDHSYDLPVGFDPNAHQAISVWCKRFTANFARRHCCSNCLVQRSQVTCIVGEPFGRGVLCLIDR